MNMYEFYKGKYDLGLITKDELKEIVRRGRITADEYTLITGDEYIDSSVVPIPSENDEILDILLGKGE